MTTEEKEITEEKAISLLRKYAPDRKTFNIILAHVKAVQKVALRIARQCSGTDLNLISVGSLLHDIGRFSFPPGKKSIAHGIEGARIIRKELGTAGENIARICETHIGTGISKEDIKKQNLELPLKDYVPETKEELIIGYADNLIDYDTEKGIKYAINRFRNDLGEEYAARIKEQHEKVLALIDKPTIYKPIKQRTIIDKPE